MIFLAGMVLSTALLWPTSPWAEEAPGQFGHVDKYEDPTRMDSAAFGSMPSGASPRTPGDLVLPASLPEMRLVARLRNRGEAVIAMLRVEGRTYLVHAGTEISMLTREGRQLVLRVEYMDAIEAHVNVLPYNRKVILR